MLASADCSVLQSAPVAALHIRRCPSWAVDVGQRLEAGTVATLGFHISGKYLVRNPAVLDALVTLYYNSPDDSRVVNVRAGIRMRAVVAFPQV